jgi:hypothetical protein
VCAARPVAEINGLAVYGKDSGLGVAMPIAATPGRLF